MRTLYVVGGMHPCNGLPLHQFTTYAHLMDIQDRFIALTATNEHCTGHFHDGTSKSVARHINELVDCLIEHKIKQEECLKLVQHEEKAKKEYGICEQLKYLISVRESGVPITILPTEERFDPLSYLKSELPELHDFFKVIEDMVGKKIDQTDVYHIFYNLPKFAEMLSTKRDSEIFENICKHGHTKNILFIGRSHQLRDFREQKHDFKVFRVDFSATDNAYAMHGKLPARMRKIVTECHIHNLKKGYFLDEHIEYV